VSQQGPADQPAQLPVTGQLSPVGMASGPPPSAVTGPGESWNTSSMTSSITSWITKAELRFAAVLLVACVAIGAVLGVCWRLWSHTATLGQLLGGHSFIPDETEGFISSDGRFVVLTGGAGLLLGAFAWSRRQQRGPATAVALVISAVIGAVVCDLVGRLLGGGRDTGPVGTIVDRLPLQVHGQVFLLSWAFAALVVYLLCALFAESDDLGRASGAPSGPVMGAVSSPSPSTAGSA
jgi:hypothetical protein